MSVEVYHMAKGNINYYKGTFKALCNPISMALSHACQASYSIDKVNCKICLMALLSHKEEDILKIEKKLSGDQ